MDSESKSQKKIMDSFESNGKSVKEWDKKEDLNYEGHKYIAAPEKYFFKSLENALRKKGLIE